MAIRTLCANNACLKKPNRRAHASNGLCAHLVRKRCWSSPEKMACLFSAFSDAVSNGRTHRDQEIYVRNLIDGSVRFDGFKAINVKRFAATLREHGMTATYRMSGHDLVVECKPSTSETLDCVSVCALAHDTHGLDAQQSKRTDGGSVEMHCFKLPLLGVSQALLDAISAHPTTLSVHVDLSGLRVCVSQQSGVAQGLVASLRHGSNQACATNAARRRASLHIMRHRSTKQSKHRSRLPYPSTPRHQRATP